jgi:dTDP-4-dehydrorhamnose 3,5-epimerase
MNTSSLPEGVRLLPLQPHACARGCTTELYRQPWVDGMALPQWNLIQSVAHSLRGMQLHRHRVDYVCVAVGTLIAGLYDARAGSATHGQSCMLQLHADDRQALVIPTGVLHGFYFPLHTLYLQGMSTPWDGKDDHRCHWQDPALGLHWPAPAPIVSELDRTAPGLAEMLVAYHQTAPELGR